MPCPESWSFAELVLLPCSLVVLARRSPEASVVRMSRFIVVIVVVALVEVAVAVAVDVVIVVVGCRGTNCSGLIDTAKALSFPTIPVAPSACSVLLTICSRKLVVYNCSAMALAEEPWGTVTKALILVPVRPTGLDAVTVEDPL
jgi:hypothetical protein